MSVPGDERWLALQIFNILLKFRFRNVVGLQCWDRDGNVELTRHQIIPELVHIVGVGEAAREPRYHDIRLAHSICINLLGLLYILFIN